MLKFMRRHAKSWLIKAAFAVIIIVFVFWGVGSFRARRATILAYVNGEPIYYNEFAATYRQVLESYRERFKELNEEIIKRLNLKQTVLEQLIERKLILQAAQKMGLMTSDMELWQKITAYNVFQKNGKFDLERYQMVLARYRYTPAQFETALREDLTIQKVKKLFEKLARVSDLEAYETYCWFHHKINLAFVVFDPHDFAKKVKPKEADLKNYFAAHKEQYVIPRQLKLIYLEIPYEEFLKKVTLNEEEIKQYYEANKDIYYEPKKVCARHILFRVRPDASKEEIEKVRKKAQKVLSQIKQGKNFVKLAEKYSDDKASAKKGGDLGCFARGTMVKAFENAAFSLKKGEVSDLVKTNFGFHIIQVYDIHQERIKPLKEVRERIVQILKNEQAKEMAFKVANRIYAEAILEKDLRKAAQKYGRDVKETDYFTEDEWHSDIFYTFKKQIVSLKKGEVTSPLEAKNKYFLVQLYDEKPKRYPSFKEVKKRLEEDFIQQEAPKIAKKKAEEVLNSLLKGKKETLDWNETGFFSPMQSIPKVGYYPQAKELFSLDNHQPYLNKVVKINGKFYIFKFKARQNVSKADYERDKEKFIKRLLFERQISLYQAWVNQLRQKAEIKIRKEML